MVLCFLEQNLYRLLSNALLLLLLVTKLCETLCDAWAIAGPGSSVHGISQAGILGLTFPSPGDLAKPGTEPASYGLPLQPQPHPLLMLN